VYAGLGDKEKALEQARQAVADCENDAVAKPVAESTLAKIRARFGDAGSAITGTQRLLKVPGGITRGDPRFNPFWDLPRRDPRFQQLLGDKQSNRA
jgi:hypothetical protein